MGSTIAIYGTWSWIAVHLGHHLMIRLLATQNRYFALGLDHEVKGRVDGFVAAWGSGPTSPPQSE
jgi:hypothetical protein